MGKLLFLFAVIPRNYPKTSRQYRLLLTNRRESPFIQIRKAGIPARLFAAESRCQRCPCSARDGLHIRIFAESGQMKRAKCDICSTVMRSIKMANSSLNHIEASKTWVLRAMGLKIRDIQARYDVDPRRLYDVWEEKDHKGSRTRAIEIFRRLRPHLPISGRFEPHIPRFRRLVTKWESEPRLPGF